MTFELQFQRYKRDRPSDLIFGIVTSVLLHVILFLGYYHWQKIAPEQKRSQTPPIPIEFVEVPPNPQQVKPPPQTKRRAANDSVAGGKANPNQPISAARLARVAPKTSRRSSNSSLSSSTAVLPRPPQSQPQPRISPRLRHSPSRQRLEKIEPDPKSIATSPTIPKAKRLTREDLLPPKSVSERLATRTTTNTPKPKRLTREVSPSRSASERLATRTTAKIPSQAQPSRTSGAASRLGGAISVSGRDQKGNYQAALPNSNRFNRGTQSIDASRDVDMGSYLMQLQQRVRQQWIPGLTQSSQRTVVYFAVSRSGQVRGLRVVRPSGSSVTDQAALSAISRAAPFAPLPSGYSENFINIRFTFNINVSGQLELGVR